MKMINPFPTAGYAGPNYFCDRKEETFRITQMLLNGNNVVLMSPRRIGKTGLIQHVFEQEEIKKHYNTFLIDIYATNNLEELVQQMGNCMIKALAKRGQHILQSFLRAVSSLRATMSFDAFGIPTWAIGLGDPPSVQYTLDQIFNYLEHSDKPCLVAIDEFQQITRYPEKNVEAILRTYIQRLNQVSFIFSGSEHSLLTEMFHSPARPFFASTSSFPLKVIPEEKYSEFIQHHFRQQKKEIAISAIHTTYTLFDGITWYIQKIMSTLFMLTPEGGKVEEEDVNKAINQIITDESMNYAHILYQLTPRQKQLLIAISKEGKAKEIKGHQFISKYHLPGGSTIQATIKSLLQKQLVTENIGVYEVYDRFFSVWMNRNL